MLLSTDRCGAHIVNGGGTWLPVAIAAPPGAWGSALQRCPTCTHIMLLIGGDWGLDQSLD